MNRGILNIELFWTGDLSYISGFLHTFLKNQRTEFSAPPGGIQGSCRLYFFKLKKTTSELARTHLSFERQELACHDPWRGAWWYSTMSVNPGNL